MSDAQIIFSCFQVLSGLLGFGFGYRFWKDVFSGGGL